MKLWRKICCTFGFHRWCAKMMKTVNTKQPKYADWFYCHDCGQMRSHFP